MKLCSIGELYMKLLIVDDEELTRTGLISSIDWDSLGITEILQADDGVNGLEMAKLYKPEIILRCTDATDDRHCHAGTSGKIPAGQYPYLYERIF